MALSPIAQEVLAKISQPQEQRPAVRYNMHWVRSYRPNEDFYLSQEERDMLLASGTTTIIGQPAGTYAKQMLQRLLIDLSWNSSRLEEILIHYSIPSDWWQIIKCPLQESQKKHR